MFMNNFTISIGLLLILVVTGYTISKFFGIKSEYYLPFLLWLAALCIFNMFLKKEHVNNYTINI